MFILTQIHHFKMYNLVLFTIIYFGHGSKHSPAYLKPMHMASVEVHGEGSSTSRYDSVVKYLLRSCRGKSVCTNQENSEEMAVLHSGPLKGTYYAFRLL